MATVKVTKTDQSQNGKDRVYFDGKNNWQDAYYVKKGLYMPSVGSTIEVETSSQTFPGKQQPTWFLNKWKEVKSGPEPSRASEGGALGGSSSTPKGWFDIPTGDLSRFVSNVVGSAIAAGLIKEPVDLHRWVKSAYGAAESLRNGYPTDTPDPSERHDRDEDPDFDDKIPF